MNRKTRVKQQEQAWETALREVEVAPEKNEILFDPLILDTLQSVHSSGYLDLMKQDGRLEDEKQEQINRLRELTMEKLLGRERECLMMLLSGYDNYSEISRKLGYSRDTVRRTIEQAAIKLKACLSPFPFGPFPSTGQQCLKSALFPLDTEKERSAFQKFLDRHDIRQIALSSGSLREALILYREKPGK